MDKGQLQEALVTLYLRLNGYFTSGFIVHSPIPGRNVTELDVLAVRFPHNAEPERAVEVAGELDSSADLIDFVIGEVKSYGEQLQFNDALRGSAATVASILRWWGFLTAEEVTALVEPVAGILAPHPGAVTAPTILGPRNARVRAILFSPETNARRNNQPWFIPGPPIFAHIWRCLRPPAPRAACATTYDFGTWGRELEPIVRYFKDPLRQDAGGFHELIAYLGIDDR